VQIAERRKITMKSKTAIILVLSIILLSLSVYFIIKSNDDGSATGESVTTDDVHAIGESALENGDPGVEQSASADESPEAGGSVSAGEAPGAGESISVDEVPGTGESVSAGEAPGVGESVTVDKVPGVGGGVSADEVPAAGEGVLADEVPAVGENSPIITSERRDKPTPNGGDYSEIFYFDDDGNSVDKTVATKAVVKEYKIDGTLINEIFADISH